MQAVVEKQTDVEKKSASAVTSLRKIDKRNMTPADVQIFVTKNYDMFHFSDFNREAKLSKKLSDSIQKKDLTKFNPILVDEKGIIIDGQHRFVVCKLLGLPVYYIVGEGLEINHAANINQATKNWTTLNFIEYYVKTGYPTYVKLSKLAEKYFTPVTNLLALGKGSVDKNETMTDLTKSGKFSFREHLNPDEILSKFQIFREYIDFADNTILFKAYLRVASLEGYDHNRMLKKLKETSGFYLKRMPTQQAQNENMLKTYNYGIAKGNRLKLDKQGKENAE